MKESRYLAGAFDAYGLAEAVKAGGKRMKVSLMTSSANSAYVKRVYEYSGLGHVKPFRGHWQWICDDPREVKTFWLAVGPHLTEDKRSMIEAAWEQWRRAVLDYETEMPDPGAIDEPLLYPDLQAEIAAEESAESLSPNL